MSKLRISKDLALPIETVTESIAILAKRNAGKTYTASVLVEEMLKAKLQVVVLDPMGAWWGLRSSADGKGPGFPIARLGGDHGDVPLEPTGGIVVADLVVDEGLAVILDLAPFSKNERRRFVADFLERLYHKNRDAMHVVLEEADLFAPEGKLKRAGDEAMLGAVYDLVRRGRGRGIGSTLITQRSASLSKEVLTQAEILLALRTTGPQDIAAIKEWIRYHGTDEERDVVLGSLHELPTGEAWAWWPVEGVLKRIRIRERETFDSSATPKPGQARREPKTIADVDLGALQKQMAATIEKAKAEDPKELRRQVAELKRELAKRPTETKVETVEVEKIVEVPVLDYERFLELQNGIKLEPLAELLEQLAAVRQAIYEGLERAVELRESRPPASGRTRSGRGGPSRPRASGDSSTARTPDRRSGGAGSTPAPRSNNGDVAGDFQPSGPQQRILDALAALEAIGVPDAQKTQLALFAEASPRSSSYTNNLGSLRTAGLIAYPGPQLVRLTDAGRAIADGGRAPTSTDELHEFVFGLVGGSKARLLQVLIAAYEAGDALSKVELAERAGASATSSSFTNNLGSLRSLGLIDYPEPGMVEALPVLFLEEAIA